MIPKSKRLIIVDRDNQVWIHMNIIHRYPDHVSHIEHGEYCLMKDLPPIRSLVRVCIMRLQSIEFVTTDNEWIRLTKDSLTIIRPNILDLQLVNRSELLVLDGDHNLYLCDYPYKKMTLIMNEVAEYRVHNRRGIVVITLDGTVRLIQSTKHLVTAVEFHQKVQHRILGDDRIITHSNDVYYIKWCESGPAWGRLSQVPEFIDYIELQSYFHIDHDGRLWSCNIGSEWAKINIPEDKKLKYFLHESNTLIMVGESGDSYVFLKDKIVDSGLPRLP